MNYNSKLTTLSKIMIIVVIVVVVTPVSILLFEERMAKTNLNILDNEIEIKAGLADRYYKSNAITDVYLKDTIPKFNKINGVDMGNINRGKFNVQGLGEGFLFLESSKGPYLYIIMGKDFVIINDKDEQKIKHFYTELLKYKKKLIYNY
ncbi:hypothetical protein [Clostridium arbusti]|uniref:hypothetical protein n=1 Tax=Clostridium arbusti TaxID=1137848 RepID=UPI0002881E68|nr:hypothetical protein [Clostridium arbusti]